MRSTTSTVSTTPAIAASSPKSSARYHPYAKQQTESKVRPRPNPGAGTKPAARRTRKVGTVPAASQLGRLLCLFGNGAALCERTDWKGLIRYRRFRSLVLDREAQCTEGMGEGFETTDDLCNQRGIVVARRERAVDGAPVTAYRVVATYYNADDGLGECSKMEFDASGRLVSQEAVAIGGWETDDGNGTGDGNEFPDSDEFYNEFMTYLRNYSKNWNARKADVGRVAAGGKARHARLATYGDVRQLFAFDEVVLSDGRSEKPYRSAQPHAGDDGAYYRAQAIKANTTCMYGSEFDVEENEDMLELGGRKLRSEEDHILEKSW